MVINIKDVRDSIQYARRSYDSANYLWLAIRINIMICINPEYKDCGKMYHNTLHNIVISSRTAIKLMNLDVTYDDIQPF